MHGISGLCPYLALKPSRALRRCVVGIHLLALAALWLSALPTPPRLWLSLAVGWSQWRHLHPNPKTLIYGLRLLDDKAWRLDLPGGQEEALLLGSSIVTPWFVLLHVQAGASFRALLICRDSLEPDAFRRLRVALRVAGPAREGAGISA